MGEIVRWAHQGGAKEGPSNTIAAMRRALCEDPGTALECDVHSAKGGELVVIHDKDLHRTTSGCGKVRKLEVDELQQFDAGYWFVEGSVADHQAEPHEYRVRGRGPADPEYRIPTLREVLDAFPDTPFTIEIKSPCAAFPLIDELAGRNRRDVTVVAICDPTVWLARWRMRRYPEWTTPLAAPAAFTTWFQIRSLFWPMKATPYTRVQVSRRFLPGKFLVNRLLRGPARPR